MRFTWTMNEPSYYYLTLSGNIGFWFSSFTFAILNRHPWWFSMLQRTWYGEPLKWFIRRVPLNQYNGFDAAKPSKHTIWWGSRRVNTIISRIKLAYFIITNSSSCVLGVGRQRKIDNILDARGNCGSKNCVIIMTLIFNVIGFSP